MELERTELADSLNVEVEGEGEKMTPPFLLE